MSQLKEVRVLTIDIETSGPTFNHEIIAIGWVLGNPTNGQICEKARISFNVTKPFDVNTWNTFWSKHQDILKTLSIDSMTTEAAITRFMEYVDAYDQEYDLRIASDNPVFDIGFINFYLFTYLNRRPLNYILNDPNRYRGIQDTESYHRGRSLVPMTDAWLNDAEYIKQMNLTVNKNAHNHLPENDAEFIFKMYYEASNVV